MAVQDEVETLLGGEGAVSADIQDYLEALIHSE